MLIIMEGFEVKNVAGSDTCGVVYHVLRSIPSTWNLKKKPNLAMGVDFCFAFIQSRIS